MRNYEIKMSENIKNREYKMFYDDVQELYPHIVNIKEKYFLYIQASFLFPWNNQYNGEIILLDNNNNEIKLLTKILKPFHNRNYIGIFMKKGKGSSQLGVPFVFDTFQDISKIKTVIINWYSNTKKILSIVNHVTFEQEDNKQIYSIFTQNSSFQSWGDYLRYCGRDIDLDAEVARWFTDSIEEFSEIIGSYKNGKSFYFKDREFISDKITPVVDTYTSYNTLLPYLIDSYGYRIA